MISCRLVMGVFALYSDIFGLALMISCCSPALDAYTLLHFNDKLSVTPAIEVSTLYDTITSSGMPTTITFSDTIHTRE